LMSIASRYSAKFSVDRSRGTGSQTKSPAKDGAEFWKRNRANGFTATLALGAAGRPARLPAAKCCML
jgi:hypothetical protein